MNYSPEKFKLAKLYDKNGLLAAGKNNRWFVEFQEWNPSKGKLERYRYFQVNNFATLEARYQFAEQQIAEINAALQKKYSNPTAFTHRLARPNWCQYLIQKSSKNFDKIGFG